MSKACSHHRQTLQRTRPSGEPFQPTQSYSILHLTLQVSSTFPRHALQVHAYCYPCRAKLARQNSQVDAGRCALTTIHYPEQRTLTADNATSEPLPAVLQQLAATAQALTAGSGRHFAAAEIPQSGGGHRQAAASASQPLQSLTEDLSNHQSNLSDSRNSPSTSGNVQEGEHSTMAAGVRYHAAGHDPVWLLLYTVKVQPLCVE